MKAGIVGLPNVGKSTFFNLLTQSDQARVGNFPFCTIDPNVAIVDVEEDRLTQLFHKTGSKKIIKSTFEFVDIAGLIPGASEGAGLGNKFLSHIQEVDIIVHVVRCFDDDTILHVLDEINPLFDLEIIMEELVKSDLEKVARISKKQKFPNIDDNKTTWEDIIDNIKNKHYIDQRWLSTKPFIVVCNGDNQNMIKMITDKYSTNTIALNINFLNEISIELSGQPEELKEYLQDLYKFIHLTYNTVGYISFFTTGPEETRAWRITKGSTAYNAAGKIHTDIQKKLIFTEVTSFNDYLLDRPFTLQTKDYVIQDSDIIYFRSGK